MFQTIDNTAGVGQQFVQQPMTMGDGLGSLGLQGGNWNMPQGNYQWWPNYQWPFYYNPYPGRCPCCGRCPACGK